MPTFAECEALLSDADFQIKVKQAMTKVALAVVGEGTSDKAAVDTKRHDLGVSILNNVAAHEDAFRRAVVALGTITGETRDNDIEWAVSSVFGDIAGCSGSDAGVVAVKP